MPSRSRDLPDLNGIKDEGQCAPPLPQNVQQCSSAPVEDLTDKVVLLKSIQASPDKATTSTEPTEEYQNTS